MFKTCCRPSLPSSGRPFNACGNFQEKQQQSGPGAQDQHPALRHARSAALHWLPRIPIAHFEGLSEGRPVGQSLLQAFSAAPPLGILLNRNERALHWVLSTAQANLTQGHQSQTVPRYGPWKRQQHGLCLASSPLTLGKRQRCPEPREPAQAASLQSLAAPMPMALPMLQPVNSPVPDLTFDTVRRDLGL